MEKIFAIFTDSKGNPEIASILGLIAFFGFMYFSYHHYIILGKDFDPLGFGTGAGGLSGGIGAGKILGNRADYGQEQ